MNWTTSLLDSFVLLQRSEQLKGVMYYRVSVAFTSAVDVVKELEPAVLSFVSAPHIITPELLMTTRLCSSERSAPIILAYFILITSFIRKMYSWAKKVSISIHTTHSGVMRSAQQTRACYSHRLELRPKAFAACMETEIEKHAKCDVRWQKQVSSWCSITSTESRITLAVFSSLFQFILTCFRYTTSTMVS